MIKENWYTSIHCKSGACCKLCKTKKFREWILNNFIGVDDIDFICPNPELGQLKKTVKVKRIKKRRRGCSGCKGRNKK